MEHTKHTLISQRKATAAVLLFTLILGVVLGYWLKSDHSEAKAPMAAGFVDNTGDGQETSLEEQLYACPMMCVPPMEHPGDCPICGMELMSVEVGQQIKGDNSSRVRLSPAAARLSQIQVAPVVRKFVPAEIKLFGRIDYDPAHTSEVTAYMPGVIDRVYVKRAGQFVRWGDPLFDIYSSDLLEAQEQLVDALKYVPSFYAFQSGRPHVAREVPIQERKAAERADERSPEVKAALDKIAAVRHKLSVLGLHKRDIDELMQVGEATGVATIYSPIYGQVIKQEAYEGAYINTGMPVFTIADPQFVWARLDAYEIDYPWIRKTQEVEFTTDAYPGEKFMGTVVYIDPVFNPTKRTFDIGALSTDDRGGRLKAGMLVRAKIKAHIDASGKVVGKITENDKAPLVIPTSAPLITGKRAIVYIAVPNEPGVFEGREVVLGPKAMDYYIVKEGLTEGERVVVNGNFKIDSAIQIAAKPSMMSPEGGVPMMMHHDHGGPSNQKLM